MPEISRRDLLVAGLSIAGSACISHSAWGTDSLIEQDWTGSAESSTMTSPREHLLFDFDWKFKFGHASDPAKDLSFGFTQADFGKTGDLRFAKVGFDDSGWRTLNLPHDWAVELPFVHDDEEDLFHGDDPDYKLVSHSYKPLGRRFPESSIGLVPA